MTSAGHSERFDESGIINKVLDCSRMIVRMQVEYRLIIRVRRVVRGPLHRDG